MVKRDCNCKGSPALMLVTELGKGTSRASTCKTSAKPDEHDVRCFSAFFKLEQIVKPDTKTHLEKEVHFCPACYKMLEHQSSLNKRSPEFVSNGIVDFSQIQFLGKKKETLNFLVSFLLQCY